MSDVLRYEVDEGIVTLVLDRPDKRNALDTELVMALAEGLAKASGDPQVRVVALRGAGSDFCSGLDLTELEAIVTLGPERNLADAQRLGDLFVQIRRAPKPVVAVVQGRALGGGCGLATACDLVVAREDAMLGYPEVHLGFVPAIVMAILRRRLPEGKAFELTAFGARIGALEAERIGLVDRVFPAASFAEEVDAYLSTLAARPATAVALTKRLLHGLEGASFEDGIARGVEVNTLARTTEECREGVRRFLHRPRA